LPSPRPAVPWPADKREEPRTQAVLRRAVVARPDSKGAGVTLHKLRHTAASLAIAARADVKVIQTMLGHKSAAITLDVYAHLWPDRLDEVSHRLEERRQLMLARRRELMKIDALLGALLSDRRRRAEERAAAEDLAADVYRMRTARPEGSSRAVGAKSVTRQFTCAPHPRGERRPRAARDAAGTERSERARETRTGGSFSGGGPLSP
jgi:hypothetical protein